MFKILERRDLTPDIVWMTVEAPRVARSARPGQFVIVRAGEKGERIPLTIADYDPERGTVVIVTQRIGVSTRRILELQQGDALDSFAGPLGRPADFVHEDLEELRGRKMLFIAGGVGTAPVYAQVKWLHENGVRADVIIGAKNAATHILTDEMRAVAGEVFLATDDGSAGFKGLVTDLFRQLVDGGRHYDRVVAIGPMIMMKFVAATTKEYNVPTIVSLNALMVDGTGMCGACRVTVGGKTMFTCVDGPEFDAHQVDFDEAMRRQSMYKQIEMEANHKCKIGRNE
jgi:ferredoxin--NADP+ reductase